MSETRHCKFNLYCYVADQSVKLMGLTLITGHTSGIIDIVNWNINHVHAGTAFGDTQMHQ